MYIPLRFVNNILLKDVKQTVRISKNRIYKFSILLEIGFFTLSFFRNYFISEKH